MLDGQSEIDDLDAEFTLDADPAPAGDAGDGGGYEPEAPSPEAPAPEEQSPVASSSGLDASGAGSDPAALPPGDGAYREHIARLERQLQDLTQRYSPLADAYERQRQAAAMRPPVDPARIDDGSATPAELRQYLEWQMGQREAQIMARAQSEAQFQAGEMQARGQFSAEVMGPEYAFDRISQEYVRPAYAADPQLRDAVARLVPENPAIGEMFVGIMVKAVRDNGGDVVKAAKMLAGRAQAPAKADAQIRQAQARQADRAIRGQGGGLKIGSRTLDPNDTQAFNGMNDDELLRFGS